MNIPQTHEPQVSSWPKEDSTFRFLLKLWCRGWEVIGRGLVFFFLFNITILPLRLMEWLIAPKSNTFTVGVACLVICAILYLPFAFYLAAKGAGWRWHEEVDLNNRYDPKTIRGAG